MNFDILGTLEKLALESGFAQFFMSGGWRYVVMIAVGCLLLYLGIGKKFEPLLMIGIAFGCLLSNLPGGNMFHQDMWDAYIAGTAWTSATGEVIEHIAFTDIIHNGGLLDVFYIGVKAGIYPSLIFMGVGAMTDFGPLIANAKSLLLGAAAQLGVFVAFFGAIVLGFTGPQAASIGIIGGADGPTAIFLTTRLAPELLGPIAIAAYSYMALIPLIQPPIMKALTTPESACVKMERNREVTKTEKIIFPIMVSAFVILRPALHGAADRLPDAGQPVRECGVADRLSDTAQNALMNIVTIFLATSVGATMTAERFLTWNTIKIIVLGLWPLPSPPWAACSGGRIMYRLSGGKINPLIGSAGVSAVPMAARVSQAVGQKVQPRPTSS